MPILLNYPLFHADDSDGAPLTGGLLYTYIAGTSTAKSTYTTRAMVTANANPVVLDSRGEAVIYGSGLYKLILKTSAAVTIWTQDNVELGPGQGANAFFVDPTETDQGVAGNGASLYDILTALGTTEKGTVYFAHNGSSTTTTYTVSTTFNATSYTNVNFVFENGAVLAVATGVTLTLPSAANIIAQPNQQIWSGAGTVAWGTTEGILPSGWDGTGSGFIIYDGITLDAGASITEFSTDGTLGGNSDTAVPTEKAVKTYVSAIYDEARSIFTYNGGSAAYTVKAKGAAYWCKDKFCYWASELTTSAIASPVLSTWYYLYLDYSAITQGTAVTATELIWSSTAPTWSDTYRQWMNSDDRAILAVLTNTTPTDIYEFFHDGGDYVLFANALAGGQASKSAFDFTSIDVDTSWVDVYLPMPGFSTKGTATIYSANATGDGNLVVTYWRTNGQTGTTGHYSSMSFNNNTYAYNGYNSFPVISDSSQRIEVKQAYSNANTVSVWLDGWFFPIGI